MKANPGSPKVIWAAILFLCIGTNAVAAQIVDNWINPGGTANWNNAGNWSNGVPNNGSGSYYQAVLAGIASSLVSFDANPTAVDTLNVAASATLQDDGNSRFLTIGDATSPYSNTGKLVNGGAITWGNGGILTVGTATAANANITNSGVLSISDASLQVNGDFATNNGTLNIGNSSFGNVTNTLTSAGKVSVQGDSNLVAGGLNTSGQVTVGAGSFLKVGTYNISAGSTDIAGTLNASTFTQTGGTTTVEKGATLGVTNLNHSGGVLNLQGQTVAIAPPSGTFTNPGTINLQQGTSFTIAGGVLNQGSIVTDNGGGNLLSVTGNLTNSTSSSSLVIGNGSSLVTNGNLSNSGSLVVMAGCTSCTTGFKPVQIEGTLTNSGIIEVPPTEEEVLRGGITWQTVQSDFNSGNIGIGIVDALILFGPTEVPELRTRFAAAPTSSIDFSNQNSGSLSLSGDGITVKVTQGSFNNNAGASLTMSGNNETLTVAKEFNNNGTVIVSGSGDKIVGPLFANSGTVSIGARNTAPGTPGKAGALTLDGDYTQGGGATLLIDINGSGTGQFSILNVLGSASLDGKVMFDFGFSPSAGDSFTFLTAGNLLGAFSSDAFNGFGCAACTLIYNDTNGTVTLDVNGAAPAPELSTWLMLAIGLLGMAGYRAMQLRRPGKLC